MRTLLWFILGFGLTLSAGLFTVAAGGLAALGIASHLVLKREPGMRDVFSYDPTSMVNRAPLPGVIAVAFALLFFIIGRRLRASVRARSRAL